MISDWPVVEAIAFGALGDQRGRLQVSPPTSIVTFRSARRLWYSRDGWSARLRREDHVAVAIGQVPERV